MSLRLSGIGLLRASIVLTLFSEVELKISIEICEKIFLIRSSLSFSHLVHLVWWGKGRKSTSGRICEWGIDPSALGVLVSFICPSKIIWWVIYWCPALFLFRLGLGNHCLIKEVIFSLSLIGECDFRTWRRIFVFGVLNLQAGSLVNISFGAYWTLLRLVDLFFMLCGRLRFWR